MATTSEALAEHLRKIHVRAGRPTLRACAKSIGFSHTTVTDIFRARNGNWVAIDRLMAFLQANYYERNKAHELWTEANTDFNAKKNRKWEPQTPDWSELMLEELRAIRALLEKMTN